MTKMAAKSIYGKTLQKSSSSEPKDRFLHLRLQPIIVCSNDDPGLTLSYLTARSNLVTWAFLLEKVKTVDFLETNAASDLKLGRCRQLIEFMKVCEY